jgi:hypothetical protein
MGILPKNAPRKSVHPLLKSDLLQMDAIAAETRLLCKNHISTAEELAAFKAELKADMMRLNGKRTKLNNRLRRAADPEEIQQIKEQRTALTKKISGIRTDLRCVAGIEIRLYFRCFQYVDRSGHSAQVSCAQYAADGASMRFSH